MLKEKDLILINLTTDWWFLGNNPEWNNDKEVVLKAVKKWKGDLQYASDKLKNDKQIVLKAFRNNTDSICYIGDNLRKK